MKITKRYFLYFILLGVLLILSNHKYISYTSNSLIYNDINKIPKTEFALFLGTPKYLPNGNSNNYYNNRIKSVVALYKKKKILKIIISADTLNKYKENEVEFIKSDLIDKGIHQSDLIIDKDGNRTWNSISFLKNYSGDNKIIMISQKFHLERALYIANSKKINGIGFVAKGKMSNKLWIREILARVKMQMDLFFQ